MRFVPRLFASLLLAAAAHGAIRPNIILVSLDQCQADRLHVYGNARPASPNLDRMAAEGVRFSRFYSAAPWTAPSYGAMMTSQYPSRHGVTIFFPRDVSALKPDAVTLAEIFRKAGYATAAFVNNSVAGRYLTGRGFDEYDEGQRRPSTITERTGMDNPEFRAPATNGRIIQWLDQSRSKPFFLFLLYWEPHSPYDPPAEHDLFKSDAYPNETNTGWDVNKGRLFRWANTGDRKAIERLTQLYDGKIHFIDYYFGQILNKLRSSGLDKNTIVLLTSDHGELLYSHPEDYLTFDHRSLYDQVMHVPGLLWGAGVPRGKTIDALATHIDVAPTLLELADLPRKPDAQGESLVPLIRGQKSVVHTVLFGEQDIVEPLRSVRDTRYKLILNTRTGRKQLFDDRSHPGEHRDIAAQEPEVTARLSALLEKWRAENEPPPAEREGRWRQLIAKSPPAHVVDDVTIGANLQLTGSGWNMADEPHNLNGACYWTEAAKPGEQVRTAIWRTDNPMLGRYRISAHYGGLPQGGVAHNAPFTVTAQGGGKTFRLDQNQDAGSWRELGVFEDPISVKVTNDTDGRVIVDAVKFERLGSVQIHPGNAKYFLFRGKPLALITATEHYGSVLNRSFDFVKYLNDAAEKKMTLTRTFLLFRELQSARNPSSPCKPESPDYIAPWPRTGPGKAMDGEPIYDLEQWNPEYFERLRRFLSLASEKGIVVELTLFSNTYADNIWALNPLRAQNNKQRIGNVEWPDYLSLNDGKLVQQQVSYARKIIQETSGFDNIYYEICNEPGGGVANHVAPEGVDAWQREMARLIRDELRRLGRSHLVFGQEAFRYTPKFAFGVDKTFQENMVDAVNVHPLPNTIFNGRSYQLGHFMSSELMLSEVRDFCQAVYSQSKPVVLDEDNTASMYRDPAGWTIHRKRAWTALLNACHYDYIDFSITVGRESGSAESSKQIRSWMRYLSEFMDSFDFIHAKLLPNFVTGAPQHVVWSALGEEGQDYVAYLADAREVTDPAVGNPIAGSVSFDLPPGRFSVRLYSPVSGTYSPAIQIHGGKSAALDLAPFKQDLVIRATRVP